MIRIPEFNKVLRVYVCAWYARNEVRRERGDWHFVPYKVVNLDENSRHSNATFSRVFKRELPVMHYDRVLASYKLPRNVMLPASMVADDWMGHVSILKDWQMSYEDYRSLEDSQAKARRDVEKITASFLA